VLPLPDATQISAAREVGSESIALEASVTTTQAIPHSEAAHYGDHRARTPASPVSVPKARV
jgi:hypothetical protein